jgi:hypothetical protein
MGHTKTKRDAKPKVGLKTKRDSKPTVGKRRGRGGYLQAPITNQTNNKLIFFFLMNLKRFNFFNFYPFTKAFKRHKTFFEKKEKIKNGEE